MSPENKRPDQNQKEVKKRLPPPVSIVRDILVRNETSRNGRPLDERAVMRQYPSSVARFKGSMDLTPAPYKDSRQGKGMNYSAFEVMAQHWQQITDGFAWIHELHFQGRKPVEISSYEFDDMLQIAEAMPSHAFNRASAPFRRFNDLPDEVADIYKASRGLSAVSYTILKKYQDIPITSDFVYNFANDNGNLIGENQEVCAAPPRSIQLVVDALLSQKNGDPERSSLNSYFPDPENLKQFSDAHKATKYYVGGLIRSSVDLVNAFADAYYQKRLTKADQISILEGLTAYHSLEEESLFELKDIQVNINAILGRQTTGIKPPVIQDMKNILQYDPFVIAEKLGVDAKLLKEVRSRRGLRADKK
jgi:hypothetical protein